MNIKEVSFFDAPYPTYSSPEMIRARLIAANLARPHRPVYCPTPRSHPLPATKPKHEQFFIPQEQEPSS